MVLLAAEPVRELTLPREGVDLPRFRERLERPVDGREARSASAPSDLLVQLLRGDRVVATVERGEDDETLSCCPEARRTQRVLEPAHGPRR